MISVDAVVIGSGPAGLQAAYYLASRKFSVYVFGSVAESQLFKAKIANLITSDLMMGRVILETGLRKCKEIDVEFTDSDVVSLKKGDGAGFIIKDSKRDNYLAKTVIIAAGTKREKLNVEGENEYLGKGVSYCVECDAGFFKGKKVAVTGFHSKAIDAVEYLSKVASEVFFVTTASSNMLDKDVMQSGKVVVVNSKVAKIKGNNFKVTAVVLENSREIAVDGLFIELGAKGIVDLTKNLEVSLDETFTHIVVDRKCKTSVEGVFASGDVTGLPYQLGKAIGDGTVAGIEAGIFLKNIQKNSEG